LADVRLRRYCGEHASSEPYRKGGSRLCELLHTDASALAGKLRVKPIDEISVNSETIARDDPMKILYVEDNDDNVYMLKNRLSRVGFNVIVATDGAQGLTMANSEQPDLILMDLTLPDIDGKEATRRIKADPATKRIPVIALTANAMAGDKEKALAAGCDDFDTKPVELQRLLGKIAALKPQ
jgi:CheY-like chemotaxis protein